MVIYKVRLLLKCDPYRIEWVVKVNNPAEAPAKARKEIKREYSLDAGEVLEQEILSKMELK